MKPKKKYPEENHTRIVADVNKTDHTKLRHMAVARDTSLKQMIEAVLAKMAFSGMDYLDLYTQLERTTQLLRELHGEEKIEEELPL